jgi:hypothetical protein
MYPKCALLNLEPKEDLPQMKNLKNSIPIFLGALLISVGRSGSQITPVVGYKSLFFALTVLGIAMIVLGAVAVVLRFAASSSRSFWTWLFEEIRDLLGMAPLRVRRLEFASRGDLPELRDLYMSKFGDDVPSLMQMRKWHKQNPHVFMKISDHELFSGRRKIVASVKMVPNRAEAIALLDAEEVSGTTFLESHIARGRRVPAAWYIGDLVSTSSRSARAITEELVLYLADHLSDETLIYARPLTAQGMKLVQKFGFKPVLGRNGEFGRIYRLRGSAVLSMAEQLRCVQRHNRQKKAGAVRSRIQPTRNPNGLAINFEAI